MDQPDMINRQRSLSNHSSINTPKLRKRLSDFKKDSLVFSQILKKQKLPLSENNSVMGREDSKLIVERPRKTSQHNIVIKKTRDHLDLQDKARNLTPCGDLSRVFVANKLAQSYIAQMQKHKFKNLVIVGVILPTQMMKKLTKLIDFSQQYKLSLPQTLFATDFNQLLLGHHKNSTEGEQVNYVFWTYELSSDSGNNNGYSVRSSANNIAYSGRYSPASNRSIKEGRQRKMSCVEQYSDNMKSLMVEVPQIVITTKNFIKENTQLFFPQLLSDIPAPSSYDHKITLQPQLDLQKSLLYIDQQEVNNSQKSIPTPRYMQTSSRLIRQMKLKNPQMKSNPYIELQPDEEYFNEDDRDKKILLKKGQLDKLMTARSNEQLTNDKNQTQRNQNLQLFELLEKQSIFKQINYLPPSLLQNQSYLSNYAKEKYQTTNPKMGSTTTNNINATTNERTRKNSLNTKNVQRQRLQKFKHLLNEQIKMSLKKNYHYSRFCCSWIFLHFLTNFYQHNVNLTGLASQFRKYQDYNFGSKQSNDIGLDSNHSHNMYLNSGNNLYTNSTNNTYSSLLIKSLRSFKKQIELRFFQRVQNQYKGVLDEPTLRNILRTIKMQQLIFMKKNLSCILLPPKSTPLQNKNLNYAQTQLTKDYLKQIEQEIAQFMDRLEEQIYFENNKLASVVNYKLLESEYEKIIEAGFRKQKLRKKQSAQSHSSLNSEQRHLRMSDNLSSNPFQQPVTKHLQDDFTQFMQAYSSKGIKVSSQMKTFSDFMEKKKQSYLKNVYLLTKEKKSHEKEEEQKQYKQRKIKLLEMEIFKMEDKKRDVKDKNELIKKQIKSVERKVADLQNYERQDSTTKKSHHRSRSGIKGKSVVFTGTDNMNNNSRDNSNKKQSRLKKTTSFAFQIQNNSKSKSYIQQSAEKQRNRQSLNRYSNRKSIQGERFNNYNRESIQEEESKRIKLKNRCMTCCNVM